MASTPSTAFGSSSTDTSRSRSPRRTPARKLARSGPDNNHASSRPSACDHSDSSPRSSAIPPNAKRQLRAFPVRDLVDRNQRVAQVTHVYPPLPWRRPPPRHRHAQRRLLSTIGFLPATINPTRCSMVASIRYPSPPLELLSANAIPPHNGGSTEGTGNGQEEPNKKADRGSRLR